MNDNFFRKYADLIEGKQELVEDSGSEIMLDWQAGPTEVMKEVNKALHKLGSDLRFKSGGNTGGDYYIFKLVKKGFQQPHKMMCVVAKVQ